MSNQEVCIPSVANHHQEKNQWTVSIKYVSFNLKLVQIRLGVEHKLPSWSNKVKREPPSWHTESCLQPIQWINGKGIQSHWNSSTRRLAAALRETVWKWQVTHGFVVYVLNTQPYLMFLNCYAMDTFCWQCVNTSEVWYPAPVSCGLCGSEVSRC